jgi:hypothetical protein
LERLDFGRSLHPSACAPLNHVTWFNCGVEVTDQVTNERSHQVTAPTSQVTKSLVQRAKSPSHHRLGQFVPALPLLRGIAGIALNLLFPVPML